jgi:hypothetical protein
MYQKSKPAHTVTHTVTNTHICYVHALCAAFVKHVCSLCGFAYVQLLLVWIKLLNWVSDI